MSSAFSFGCHCVPYLGHRDDCPQHPAFAPPPEQGAAASERALVERIGRVLSVTPMDEWLPESELLYEAGECIAALEARLGRAEAERAVAIAGLEYIRRFDGSARTMAKRYLDDIAAFCSQEPA